MRTVFLVLCVCSSFWLFSYGTAKGRNSLEQTAILNIICAYEIIIKKEFFFSHFCVVFHSYFKREKKKKTTNSSWDERWTIVLSIELRFRCHCWFVAKRDKTRSEMRKRIWKEFIVLFKDKEKLTIYYLMSPQNNRTF